MPSITHQNDMEKWWLWPWAALWWRHIMDRHSALLDLCTGNTLLIWQNRNVSQSVSRSSRCVVIQLIRRVILLFSACWIVYLCDSPLLNPVTFWIRVQILRRLLQLNPRSIRGWMLVKVTALLYRGRPVAFCYPALILRCRALFRDHAGVTQGLSSVHACHWVGH